MTQLKKSVDISYQFLSRRDRVDAIQDDIRVIIPNLSPINACKWLLSRATTQTGSPFFLWASIHDENLRMGNLDVMYRQTPFNDKLPYTYNKYMVEKLYSNIMKRLEIIFCLNT